MRGKVAKRLRKVAGFRPGTTVRGQVDKADHAATRPITPYESLAWTTAVAIVRERSETAKQNYVQAVMEQDSDDRRIYLAGRYEMAKDILIEMEERGKP